MATKLTKRAVDDLRPRAARYDVYDTEIPRFALRVAPDGTKTFSLLYRVGSGRSAPTKRLTIGQYKKITVEQARQIARDALATVAKGGDPAAARNEAKTAPTVAALGKDYLDDVHARRKPSTAKEYVRLWDKHVAPAIGSRRVVDITTADVARLHRSMRPTPYLANRVLALLGSFFGYAERHDVRPEHANPAHKVEAYTERSRERFLTAEEIARLGDALTRAEREGLAAPELLRTRKRGLSRKRRAKLTGRKRGPYKRVADAPKRQRANPYAVAAIRFLLLSGWRESEALTLKWSDIDVARGLATLLDTKTGKSHRWIGAPARLLLDELARVDDCEYVFPGADGKKRLATLSRQWTIVRAAAKLDDVRLHDLRHSFASVNASSGGSLLIIGKLLGHKNAATTARYAHLLDDPVKAAADQTAETLATWMISAPTKAVR